MKIVLTGSLGHVSKPLTKELVQKGHTITVVSSNAERQKDIEALGAKAAIGSLEDVAFLTKTFAGADAVYTMIPPPRFTGPDFDRMAQWSKLINNYAQAIQRSGVKRVVHLSSIGAHMEKDSGLIIGHHNAEVILNKLSNVNITFMRPVGFYYNLLNYIPAIKNTGGIALNYGADDMIPWVSPIDIAAAIAEEIVIPLSGRKVLYIASEELTCNEVASILGSAIGKPDLKWTLITNELMLGAYEIFGMPKTIATGLVEMQASMHSGEFYNDYYLHKPALGKVKLKDYAKEFAAVYNKK